MGPPPPLCPNSDRVYHPDFMPGYNSHLPPPPNNQQPLSSSEGGGPNFSHDASPSPAPGGPQGSSSHNLVMQYGSHQVESLPGDREKHDSQVQEIGLKYKHI